MSTQVNYIGLDSEHAAQLARGLDDLLANLQVFYQNARGFHWNIRGEKFFELHVKFEELYTDLLVKIDEVAERILTLGHTPSHSFSQYVSLSGIVEQTSVSDGRAAVASILEAFKILIRQERQLLDLSANAGDEGTNALMSDYIREQEKHVWMYAAYLNE